MCIRDRFRLHPELGLNLLLVYFLDEVQLRLRRLFDTNSPVERLDLVTVEAERLLLLRPVLQLDLAGPRHRLPKLWDLLVISDRVIETLSRFCIRPIFPPLLHSHVSSCNRFQGQSRRLELLGWLPMLHDS